MSYEASLSCFVQYYSMLVTNKFTLNSSTVTEYISTSQVHTALCGLSVKVSLHHMIYDHWQCVCNKITISTGRLMLKEFSLQYSRQKLWLQLLKLLLQLTQLYKQLTICTQYIIDLIQTFAKTFYNIIIQVGLLVVNFIASYIDTVMYHLS